MYTYNFIISTETPSKKNNVKYSRYGTYKTKRFKDWHQRAMLEILGQKHLQHISEPVDSPVCIHLHFIHGDNARRDSDNECSSIMDLLMDAEILKDDRWHIVKKIRIDNDYIKNNARCEISITSLDDIKEDDNG